MRKPRFYQEHPMKMQKNTIKNGSRKISVID
jgi:hypothetical protein